jgi:hypothetical protein
MSDTHRALDARRRQVEIPNLPKYIVAYDIAAEIENELNQCRRELAAAKAEAEKWEKLHDADTAHLVSVQMRDNYGPTETLNETAIRISRERIDCCMEAEKQRDMLAEALRKVRDYKGYFGEEDPASIAIEALATVKGKMPSNTLTWKPTSDLVTTFDDNSFSIKEGTRIYAVRLSTGFYDIFLAYVDDECDFCHLSGDTVGWRWDDAELYLDIELPKLPTTKGGQS